MKDQKLAAIVFTDIVGYTRQMEANEEKTLQLLERQREIIFPLVSEFGGEIIKEIGDGLMMMFTSANRAVRFAIAVQDRLKDEEFKIRAGIHIGDVIFDKGDVFGSAVNIAARIEPLAPAGGICISKDVRNQIRNQGDILTVSVGNKELKGVKEAVQVYKIATGKLDDERVSVIRDLWRRRVVQITFFYILLSYLFKWISELIVGQYMLSPHLSQLVWLLLISLIPSIIIISYFHGRRGVSKWTKFELIGLPVNLVLAIVILFMVFEGKDLGAMTTTVTYQDDKGQDVEVLVAKSEFKKKILLFAIENKTADPSLDYMQYGLLSMIELDLAQDILLAPLNSLELYDRIEKDGYKDATGLPLRLMHHYAGLRHMNYFMYGEFTEDKDGYTVRIKLHDAGVASLISDFEISNENIFALVDEISKRLKGAMGLPDSHISQTRDLDVKEIFTGSDSAMYYYSLYALENARGNWEGNVRYLEHAIQADTNFAIAYVNLTLSYFNLGDIEGVNRSLKRALQLAYNLSKRQQFILKFVNFVMKQQPEEALEILKMWVELYPDDIKAHFTIGNRYAVKGMYPEAIGHIKRILQIDPEQYQYLEALGELYLTTENFDSALYYYQEYANKFPQQSQSYRNLGNYYALQADFIKARENYNKAILIADLPEQLPLKIDLALMMLRTGEFESARDQYTEALNISRNARDSAMVYGALEDYYLIRGKVFKSLEAYEKRVKKNIAYMPPKDYLANQALNLNPYLNAGMFDKAVEVLEEIGQQLEPPLDNLVPFGYMFIYTENGDVEKAREAMVGAEKLIKGFGQESLMANVYYIEGRLGEITGDYKLAIEKYEMYKDIVPTGYAINKNIARCYRHLKEYDNAEDNIAIALKHNPYGPQINYEAALLYFDQGNTDLGIQYLEKALRVWEDADPEYKKAAEAREKYTEIQAILD